MEIVNEILSVCDNGEAKKTAIMYQSSLNYGQMRRYLGLLSDQDLIQRKEDATTR